LWYSNCAQDSHFVHRPAGISRLRRLAAAGRRLKSFTDPASFVTVETNGPANELEQSLATLASVRGEALS
jgi:hypothetical protein